MHSFILISSYLAVFLPALAGLIWAMQRMTH